MARREQRAGNVSTYLERLKASRPDVGWDAEVAGAHPRRAQAAGAGDELDQYLEEQMRDPKFRAAYEAHARWIRRAYAGPLAVDGHEYQRRLRSRRRRKR